MLGLMLRGLHKLGGGNVDLSENWRQQLLVRPNELLHELGPRFGIAFQKRPRVALFGSSRGLVWPSQLSVGLGDPEYGTECVFPLSPCL